MKGFVRVAFGAALFGVTVTACAVDDVGAVEDIGDVASVESGLSTPPCRRSRSNLLADLGPERRAILERGFRWYDADVQYSQVRYYQGYRTDCSGFVEMAWDLPDRSSSYTTYTFNNGVECRRLQGYSELLPGDALVRRADGKGHIVLFLGWDDDAQTDACVLELRSPADDMQFARRATSQLRNYGYRAIRSDYVPDAL